MFCLLDSPVLTRHQTLESMFIMYRTTKDVKWRERGWQIWEAIESKTRTASGYASVHGVEAVYPPRSDSMPRCAALITVSSLFTQTSVTSSRKRSSTHTSSPWTKTRGLQTHTF